MHHDLLQPAPSLLLGRLPAVDAGPVGARVLPKASEPARRLSGLLVEGGQLELRRGTIPAVLLPHLSPRMVGFFQSVSRTFPEANWAAQGARCGSIGRYASSADAPLSVPPIPIGQPAGTWLQLSASVVCRCKTYPRWEPPTSHFYNSFSFRPSPSP